MILFQPASTRGYSFITLCAGRTSLQTSSSGSIDRFDGQTYSTNFLTTSNLFSGSSIGSIGSRAYFFGGYNPPNNPSGIVSRYEGQTVETLGFTPFYQQSIASSYNRNIYLFGSVYEIFSTTMGIYKYTEPVGISVVGLGSSDDWQLGSLELNGIIYISDTSFVVSAFNPTTSALTQTGGTLVMHAAAKLSGIGYVFNPNPTTNETRAQSFDGTTATTITVDNVGLPSMGNASAHPDLGRIYIFGVYNAPLTIRRFDGTAFSADSATMGAMRFSTGGAPVESGYRAYGFEGGISTL